jgi:hypothetical protein
VTGLQVPLASEAARSTESAGTTLQRLAFAVPAGGTYYVEVRLTHPTRDVVSYTLGLATRR